MNTATHSALNSLWLRMRASTCMLLVILATSPSSAQNSAPKDTSKLGQGDTKDNTQAPRDFKGYRVISGGCVSQDKDQECLDNSGNGKDGNGKNAQQKGSTDNIPATVQRTGDVKVGTQTGDKVTTVFVGDTVETSSNSAAVITTEGSTVYVPANTDVVYGKNQISVGCGGAVVSTVTGMTANVMNTSIQIVPENEYSRYEVNQTNGTIQIAAREGTVVVKNGAKYATLAAGASMTFAGSACVLPPIVTFPATTAAGISGATAAASVVGIKVLSPVTPTSPN